ncbi:MAG: hypothetical protein R3325_05690, partial [Thermoanaerobaculia bacterium]|nr:hypothetical protein [Thermoanaerobaculia bacterium]
MKAPHSPSTPLLAALVMLALAALPATAAAPPTGSLNPTLGDQVEWDGTAPGGVSPGPQFSDHDGFCEDGVTCEYYELELTGTVAD